MPRRLVWNFETSGSKTDFIAMLPLDTRDELKWELRYFWPENEIITIKQSPEYFLELSRYDITHHDDTYYLMQDDDLNIKLRRDTLIYKPLITAHQNLKGFGKKISLEEGNNLLSLPGTNWQHAELLRHLAKNSRKIQVLKEALKIKLSTTPKCTLELSRIKLGKTIHFSACVEGRSASLVTAIGKHLFGTTPACDYIYFLKTMV